MLDSNETPSNGKSSNEKPSIDLQFITDYLVAFNNIKENTLELAKLENIAKITAAKLKLDYSTGSETIVNSLSSIHTQGDKIDLAEVVEELKLKKDKEIEQIVNLGMIISQFGNIQKNITEEATRRQQRSKPFNKDKNTEKNTAPPIPKKLFEEYWLELLGCWCELLMTMQVINPMLKDNEKLPPPIPQTSQPDQKDSKHPDNSPPIPTIQLFSNLINTINEAITPPYKKHQNTQQTSNNGVSQTTPTLNEEPSNSFEAGNNINNHDLNHNTQQTSNNEASQTTPILNQEPSNTFEAANNNNHGLNHKDQDTQQTSNNEVSQTTPILNQKSSNTFGAANDSNNHDLNQKNQDNQQSFNNKAPQTTPTKNQELPSSLKTTNKTNNSALNDETNQAVCESGPSSSKNKEAKVQFTLPTNGTKSDDQKAQLRNQITANLEENRQRLVELNKLLMDGKKLQKQHHGKAKSINFGSFFKFCFKTNKGLLQLEEALNNLTLENLQKFKVSKKADNDTIDSAIRDIQTIVAGIDARQSKSKRHPDIEAIYTAVKEISNPQGNLQDALEKLKPQTSAINP